RPRGRWGRCSSRCWRSRATYSCGRWPRGRGFTPGTTTACRGRSGGDDYPTSELRAILTVEGEGMTATVEHDPGRAAEDRAGFDQVVSLLRHFAGWMRS